MRKKSQRKLLKNILAKNVIIIFQHPMKNVFCQKNSDFFFVKKKLYFAHVTNNTLLLLNVFLIYLQV